MIRVVDWRGNTLSVGMPVIFGAPDTPEEIANQTGIISEIGEPDVLYNPVTDADDGGYGLTIVVKFPNGDTEKVWAGVTHLDDHEEEYLASDDLEVAAPST